MTSALGEAMGQALYLLIGPMSLSDSSYVVNVPFIVGSLFVAVLLYDICHMLGVLLHGS